MSAKKGLTASLARKMKALGGVLIITYDPSVAPPWFAEARWGGYTTINVVRTGRTKVDALRHLATALGLR